MNEQALVPDASTDATAIDELERQVERGSFFTQTSIGRNSVRLSEVESFIYGLIDVLLAKGHVLSDELASTVEKVRREAASKGDVPTVGVALRVDGPTESQGTEVKVNCAERMHICHAICCKLDFALTQEEVETGQVKWDLGRPYYIRHGSNGFCTHNNRKSGFCGVYENRPSICKTYSCANDGRIWKDFEKMELNVEWLEKNLSGSSRPLIMHALLMQPVEQMGDRNESSAQTRDVENGE